MGPRVLKLNVGGQIFATTYQTLARQEGSLLAEMVTEAYHASASYLDGAVFIDRNPRCFEVLLDWLRDQSAPLPADVLTQEALLRDAAFYRLPELTAALSRLTPQTMPISPSKADASEARCSQLDVSDRRFRCCFVPEWTLLWCSDASQRRR